MCRGAAAFNNLLKHFWQAGKYKFHIVMNGYAMYAGLGEGGVVPKLRAGED